jgi:hypothetical protein
MAILSLRSNFAINHLRAAARAARDANDIEQANATAAFGPWFDEMMRLVPVSIVMAAAALEANANELIQDILDGSTTLLPTKGCRLLLVDLKKDRSGSATNRYWRLALLFDKEPDTGTAAWKDAKLLANFRNSFMHFKPAWDHEKATHDSDLVKALKSKVPVCPAYQSNFQFPYGFMTYGCARWSVQSVPAFSSEFSTLLGVKDTFVAPGLNFTLP